jgi:aldehyde:ferredoxin oxidoreductase
MAVASPPLGGFELFPAQRTTPLPGGYMGKLLHVDLSAGRCTDLNLPEEPLLRKLWGGQALGSYILMKLLPLDARALEPRTSSST